MTIMNVTSQRLSLNDADTSSNDYMIEYQTFADNSTRSVKHLTYRDAMQRATMLRRRAYRNVVVRRMFIM